MRAHPAPGEAPGTAARQAAVHLLHRVTTLGQPLMAELDRERAGLAASDRALVHALVGDALRHLPGIDRLIDAALSGTLPADARARQVLRIALSGWLYLKTPPYAVVATALPLVHGGPRRLVHGVLSSLFRADPPAPAAELPAFFRERWLAEWGAEAVAAMTSLFEAPPPLDLALRDPQDTPALAARLADRGFPCTSFAPGHLRLAAADVTVLPGFAEGAFWVQDFAAGIAARLLGDVAGRDVLDLCAAPGGKTMQLAAAGACVTAVDRSRQRLRLLAENLARVRLEAEIIEADLLAFQPGRRFDAILLDAPCSATGTFRRHPDVLYRGGLLDLRRLAAQQQRMLEGAAQWLKPGGRLVYAVCSLEQEEGEDHALAEGLEPDPVTADELALLTGETGRTQAAGHKVRILPGGMDEGGLDGFFMARFRRSPF